jgi:hypothetical protein
MSLPTLSGDLPAIPTSSPRYNPPPTEPGILSAQRRISPTLDRST